MNAGQIRTFLTAFLNVATSGLWSWDAIRGQASRMDAVRAFIMSNDTANLHSGIVTVVPLTSKLKKSYLPTHVILADECPALEPSMVLGEQLTTVGKTSR